MINERLKALRKEMEKRGIDFYYIPTGDYHNTENVADFFKTRQYMSGFTGSEGDLLVGRDEAWLWIDGRYFIQAKKELSNTAIKRMEIGEEGVLSIVEVLRHNMKADSTLGMDGKVANYSFIKEIKEKLCLTDERILSDEDLVGKIWKDRPTLSEEKALFIEDLAYEKRRDKIQRVRFYMEKNNIEALVLTQLDDIAWTLNMRGKDVTFFPVVLSYMIFLKDKILLFINENKISDVDRKSLEADGIEIRSYEEIFEVLKALREKRISLDDKAVSYEIIKTLGERDYIFETSPIVLCKSMKNEKEIEDTINAHIKDGVAMVKFLCWLHKIEDKRSITELDVAKKIDELRSEQDGFIEKSFQSISAYKENAAIVHYSPSKECKSLDNRGILLLDSGAHYIDGTTDVTRSIVLGSLTLQEKLHYTSVLRAMIRLGKSKFLEGCNGMNLDILARGILWDMNLDYKHGTGHGVGHVLNVHEEPIGIRWKKVDGINDMQTLREGMILSNEPGVYIEGSHGIRIENELLVRKDIKNSYGQFMKFEHLTVVPIDLKAIIVENMEKSEIEWLNNYHDRVYKVLEMFLTDEEKMWLKEATKPLVC